VFNTPLPWTEWLRRTWRDALDDDVFGLAAQLSYYLFLALFPAMLFLLAIASFFPLSNVTDDIGRSLGPFVSRQILELIQDQMRRIAEDDNGGLLTFGVAGALWSSSAALVSVVGALNRAYDIEESRPWWKVRLVALGLTLGTATFILGALTLVLAGPAMAGFLGRATGWGAPFEWAWLVLQWPIVFARFRPPSGSSTTSLRMPNRTGPGSHRGRSPRPSSGWRSRSSSSCTSTPSPITTPPTAPSAG
jgi:membrane protein